MAQKRRAAADIFREQNVMPESEEEFLADEIVSPEPALQAMSMAAPGAPPPPPSPKPSRSRKVQEPVEGLQT